jgi:mediator of RNA polymerase II transcription subunit 17, fungi type
VIATQGIDSDPIPQAKCDLIYHFLHLLLLREHSRRRLTRIGAPEAAPPRPHTDIALPPNSNQSILSLLQPVIDLLQYELFCVRVKAEMQKVVQILRRAGVPVKFHFDAVGEDSAGILESLVGNGTGHISGVTTIRIDNRRVTQPYEECLTDTLLA